jgi:hypothetical protein
VRAGPPRPRTACLPSLNAKRLSSPGPGEGRWRGGFSRVAGRRRRRGLGAAGAAVDPREWLGRGGIGPPAESAWIKGAAARRSGAVHVEGRRSRSFRAGVTAAHGPSRGDRRRRSRSAPGGPRCGVRSRRHLRRGLPGTSGRGLVRVQGTLTAGEHHLSRSICVLWMGTVVVCSAFGGAINLGPAHRGRWRTSRPPFASRLQRLRPGTAMQSRAGVCPAGRVRRIRDSNS